MADQSTPNPRRRRRRPRGKPITKDMTQGERIAALSSPRPATHRNRPAGAGGKRLAFSADKHSDLFVDAILGTPITPSGLTIIVPVEGPPVVTMTGSTARDLGALVARVDDDTAHFASALLVECLRDINVMLAANDEPTLEIVQPPQTI